MPPKLTIKNKEEKKSPNPETRKRGRPKKSLIIQELTQRNPSDVDVNTANPLADSISSFLGANRQKPPSEPIPIEPVPVPLPSEPAPPIAFLNDKDKVKRQWGFRKNPKTGELEYGYIDIQIGDVILKVRKNKYEKVDYRPTISDLPKITELYKLTRDELENKMKDEKLPLGGARMHDELVFELVRHYNKNAPMPIVEAVEKKLDEPIQDREGLEKEKLVEPIQDREGLEKEVDENLQEFENEMALQEENPIVDDDLPIPSTEIELTDKEKELTDKIGVMPLDVESTEYNKYLFRKEKLENENENTADSYDFLYPELNDPTFNIKIAKRKEFHDTMFDGKIYDIKQRAEILCNASFELLPHQNFVKNFLSLQTPYNCLLLYHSLGTGKTCSAIGIAEEMRSYMKQTGISQRILVIASPNVQKNFELQLFDDRKLKLIDGAWNLDTCIGNALLTEINPTNLKGLSRETVIQQIKYLIRQYYEFKGYDKFANYIKHNTQTEESTNYSQKEQKALEIRKIKKLFNNRLIIIDEVHNIRLTQDNKEGKKTANLLMRVVKYAENLRLVLLSATPMYNSYKEIIWLANLLNAVDKRSLISESEVFDKEGNFLPERNTKEGLVLEGGKELLQRKLTGYVSHVRGENPYTFPYRIYPTVFSLENTFSPENKIKYPTIQMNEKPIENPLEHIPVYLNQIGEYQKDVYKSVIQHLRTKSFNITTMYGQEREMPSFDNMESFGYMHLKEPIEALNIVFPNPKFVLPAESVEASVESESSTDSSVESEEKEELNYEIIKDMIGKRGLANVMDSKLTKESYELRYGFNYKPDVLTNYGRIFHPDNIGKYSSKIATICNAIKNSTGIILVFSEYKDGGVVPISLALEEMGFSRYGSASYTKNLFENPPVEPVDAVTMKPRSQFLQEHDPSEFSAAKYVMITGDGAFSPNNLGDVKYVTNKENKDGKNVKVILITRAAAEGIDFKNIRQIHILEPWYNMNRIEQIIGRGVRNLSHCNLKFEDRNVEIYLHATKQDSEEEAADLYVYRYAEKKAIQIGKITRLLKETAVDCLLNIGQKEFTAEKLYTLDANQQIKINLSSKKEVDFKIGDRPFTDVCDYMECNLECSPNANINDADLIKNTYGEDYAKMNYSGIVKRMRQLFREQNHYKRNRLYASIKTPNEYPDEHIDYTISKFVDNKNQIIFDKYGRTGYLVNSGDYYAFQPIEITDEHSSIYDRTVPVTYNHDALQMELPKEKENANPPPKNLFKLAEETTEETIEPRALEENIANDYDILIQKIKEQMAYIDEFKVSELSGGEIDWHKHLGKVHDILTDDHEVPEELIYKYAVYHLLDTLSLEERVVLAFFIYKDIDPNRLTSEIEQTIKLYFDEKIIQIKDKKGIVLASNNKNTVYVQNKEDMSWKEATPTETRDSAISILNTFSIKRTIIRDLVGFMHLFKSGDTVFKTKDMTEKRNNKGAKCSSAGKKDLIIRLNEVLKENPYRQETTLYNDDNAESILKGGLCVILEIVMRYYNDDPQSKDKAVWFFDLEKALANKIVSL